MIVEFIGKFYDNHSLTIINRSIAIKLSKKFDMYLTPVDEYDPQFNLSSDVIGELKKLEQKDLKDQSPDIQIRHSYPPQLNL